MKKQYKTGQHVYRLPPCPSYDISGMESWLSALAEKGLFLTQDGFFAGFASLEVREPRKAEYRLEAAQKEPNIWTDAGTEPDPEQIELSARYSWEYVARRKDFFIYRSLDANARELNTDPAVQALALNAVKKRKRRAMLQTLFFLLLYPPLLTRGALVRTSISAGTWWTVLALLFALLMIAEEIRAFLHLKAFQESLTDGGAEAAASSRPRGAAAYFIREAGTAVLAVFLILAFLRNWGLTVTDGNKIPIDEYAGTLPFATMQDFAGEGSSGFRHTMTGFHMGFNTVEEKHDWLAPRCVSYNENAEVRLADGRTLDGGLYVDYFELKNPGLAKLLLKELYRLDRMKKGFTLLETPRLAADEAFTYLDELHFPTVLLRKGPIVVRAYFYQSSEEKPLSLEDWTGLLCESLG